MIRTLDPVADLAAVTAFLDEAADYWLLAEGEAPGPQAAAGFFTDVPPACDPALSQHLGLFQEGRLCGLAELSFGFPAQGCAYLGLLILSPRLRGMGHGRTLLAEVLDRARRAGAAALYLGVLDANPRGAAFWQREGFRPTGVVRVDDHGHTMHRLMKPL